MTDYIKFEQYDQPQLIEICNLLVRLLHITFHTVNPNIEYDEVEQKVKDFITTELKIEKV